MVMRFKVGRPRAREIMEYYQFRMLPRTYELQRMAAGLDGFRTWSAWVRHVLEKATLEALAKAPAGTLPDSEERVSW